MVQSDHEQDYIVESKRKCIEAGMDPNEIRKPKHYMSEQELSKKEPHTVKFYPLLIFSHKRF